MNNLEKIVIGLPETKKETAIIKLYSEICTNASNLLWNLEFYLECPDKLDLQMFFDFLKEKQPKDWLYLRFIEYHNLRFPGIAIARVIELGLADVPVAHFEELLKSRIELLAMIQKSKEFNFFYPLAKLFDSTPDNRGFAITSMEWGFDATELDNREYRFKSEDFDQKLYDYVRKFTVSAKENEVLEAINKTIDSLNDLVALGVIRNDRQRWGVDVECLLNAIVFSLNEEKPLSINPMLPKFKGFTKHFENRGWSQIQGSPENILRFVEPNQEQLEEIPEDIFHSEYQEYESTEETTENFLQDELVETEQAEATTEEIIQTE